MEGIIKDSSGKDTYRKEVEKVLHLFECLSYDADAVAASIAKLCYTGRDKKVRLSYKDGRFDLTRDYGGLLYIMCISNAARTRFEFESRIGDVALIQQYKTTYLILCDVFDGLLDSVTRALKYCKPEVSLKTVLGEDYEPDTELLRRFCV